MLHSENVKYFIFNYLNDYYYVLTNNDFLIIERIQLTFISIFISNDDDSMKSMQEFVDSRGVKRQD
jgi:hypothetical protein